MSYYVSVKVPSEDLVDMLVERCKAWGSSQDNLDLYQEMYEHLIEGGCFEGAKFDVMSIVDNDVVNYTSVLYEGDEDFEEILKLYKEGNYDISCETSYSYIEAVSSDETRILVRY